MEHERPKVGIGVAVIRDGKVLLGKQKSPHGNGDWSCTGGHLEFGETWEECAIRETREEAGLMIENVRFGAVTNDIFRETGKHYITIFMVANASPGDPAVLEPDKWERWEWFDWKALPSPLFLPIVNLVARKFDPLDID
jgi:8-oxo-dGTP diphosphatase